MKQAISVKSVSFSKPLAFSALFAALCCIGTLLIVIPLPSSGFFNTGDVFVLLSGWCLGPFYGAIAAAVGSALADVISGYALYAPATFVIKGCMAFIAYTVCAFCKKFVKKETLDFLPRSFSAIVAEGIMVGGYFLFECLLYTSVGAIPNLLGNTLQGVCCLSLATVLIAALRPIKAVQKFFPVLSEKK